MVLSSGADEYECRIFSEESELFVCGLKVVLVVGYFGLYVVLDPVTVSINEILLTEKKKGVPCGVHED